MARYKMTDLTYLKEIAEDSNEFILEMINSFIENTPSALVSMDKAFKEKNWPELKVIAHTMKSSIHFIGIHSIKEIIREIEKYAEERIEHKSLPDLISKTKHACIIGLKELTDEIKNFS